MSQVDKKKACVISSYAYIENNNNYGALFQYYALQKFLERNGILSYWLRYIVENFGLMDIMRMLKNSKSLVKSYLYIKCHYSFMSFIKKELRISKYKYKSNQDLINNLPEADYYFTGSDQVFAGTLQANYLCFAPSDKPKFAFSASFGKESIDSNQESIIMPWLNKFDYVTVREKSGVAICSKMGIESEHIVDPTLMLDKEEYPELQDDRIVSEKFVYCYFTNIKNSQSEVYWEEICTFASSRGYKIVVTPVQGSEKFFDTSICVYPTPKDWLRYYRDAECVITNTFHGSVFAIIFRKQFLSILQSGQFSKQNVRLTSLLDSFSLYERAVKSKPELDNIMNTEIDWNNVESILKIERTKSQKYIERINECF